MAGRGYYPRTELVGEHPKLLDPEEARTGFHGSTTDLRGDSIVPQEALPWAEESDNGLRRRWSMSSPQHVNYVTHNSSMRRSGPSSPWEPRNPQQGRERAEESAWLWAASGDPATPPGAESLPGDGRPRVYEGVAEGEVGADPNLVLFGEDLVSPGARREVPMAAPSFRVTDTHWIPPGKPGRAVQGTLPGINWNQFGAPNVGNPEDVAAGLTKEDQRHADERVLEAAGDAVFEKNMARITEERRARPDYQAGELRKAVEDPAGQLPLFAMAKDLKGAVKPLEGDREVTDRLPDDPPELDETHGYDYKHRFETDDEVWARKLDESNRLPSGRWVFSTSGGLPQEVDSTLRADIAEHGVERPVRVAGAPSWGAETGSQFPEGTVLDGHHRLAVMGEDRPDSWMQVDWEQGPTKTGEPNLR